MVFAAAWPRVLRCSNLEAAEIGLSLILRQNDMLITSDMALRGALTKMIAERGFAPSLAELGDRVGATVEDVKAALRRLHDAHALLLHPHECRPWVVHPFALSPGSCWVQTQERGYWANCLYCSFGVAAALRCDAVITTRIAGEVETVRYTITASRPNETEDIFHLSTPAARWWDNVIHACASFQPFHKESDVDDWCNRHDMPKGAVMTIPALWSFAQDWYGGYLETPWRKRSGAEARELFARHGLRSEFWAI